MNEQWIPANGYVGYYEVSDMGRVRTVERRVTTYGSRKRLVSLEYCSIGDNNRHALATGLRVNPSGSSNGMANYVRNRFWRFAVG